MASESQVADRIGLATTELLPRVATHLRRGDVAGAEKLCWEVLQTQPERADALFGLGLVAERARRLDEAIGLLQRALAAELRIEICLNLARMLAAAGRDGDALADVRRRLDRAPRDADALARLAALEEARKDIAGAVATYRQLLAVRPEIADAWFQLGILLNRIRRFADAVPALRRAASLDPRFAATPNLGNALLRQGEAAQAVSAYDASLAANPREIRAIANKAVALTELGDRAGARRLLDYDRFLRPIRLQPPDGYASLEDFNGALARFAMEHPTLAFEPPPRSTRGGSQTGEIDGATHGPMAALEGMLRAQAELYLAALPEDPGHPFLATRPQRWWLSIWATVLQAEGHQVPHLHPDGHIGGVYYVQLPRAVAESGDAHEGWIEFGRPPPAFRCRAEPETRMVQPEEGMLLLFPSYFYHRTIPFRSHGLRISIAFDLVPEA